MSYVVVAKGLLLPFLGTSLGSALVFFMKGELNHAVQKILTGFASGVMIAASVWSLLIPAIEQCENFGKLASVPAVAGFCLGIILFLLLDFSTPHMHPDSIVEGSKSDLQRTTMMVLAVVLHNIPEGMAVGVVLAGWLSGKTDLTQAAALTLAFGIAVQNFPEGAIISMPLRSNDVSKMKSFFCGVASGVVEPVAGLLTVILANYVVSVLPYLLGFAAGAMMYVVVEELIPEMTEGKNSRAAALLFMCGFSLMMFLDVALS